MHRSKCSWWVKKRKKVHQEDIPLYALLQRWYESLKVKLSACNSSIWLQSTLCTTEENVGLLYIVKWMGFHVPSQSFWWRELFSPLVLLPKKLPTCINWREASKSSTGYILIRKNFIPIIKLIMLWTIYGLCSLCRNSLSSAINFFFTAGNLKREQEWFIK